MKVHPATVVDREGDDCAVEVRASVDGNGGIRSIQYIIGAGPSRYGKGLRPGVVDHEIRRYPGCIGDRVRREADWRAAARQEFPVTFKTICAVAGLICTVELLPTFKQLML